jgi:hypothetical protein
MPQANVCRDYALEAALKQTSAAGYGSLSTRSSRTSWPVRVVVVVCLLFLPSTLLRAQGTLDYVVLPTGGGQPLVSDQLLLQMAGVATPTLFFDFGFFTEETLIPNDFLDSFTVTVQDDANVTAVLVTVDASGTVWTPVTPGGVLLFDGDIQRTVISPPSLQPVFLPGVAFSVAMRLPVQFAGPTVTVYFDLFDNLNEKMSTGWYRNPRIGPIPEPHPGWICALGLGLFWVTRRRHQNDVIRA